MTEEDPITTLSPEYKEAMRAARAGEPLSAHHVAALFDVSYTTAIKWTKRRPELCAYKKHLGSQFAWRFPVDTVEQALGFKIRGTT